MAKANHKKLRKLIASKKQTITDQELFTSQLISGHFTAIAQGMTRRYCGDTIKVIITWEDSQAYVAYTDNQTIVINANNSFAVGKERQERYRIVRGLFLHEIGHCLLTDFEMDKQLRRGLQLGVIYYPPEVPYDRFEQMVAAGTHNAILETIYALLSNTLEDGYIEPLIMAMFLTYQEDLEYVRELNYDMDDTLSQKRAMETLASDKLITIIFLILQYAKYGTLKIEEADWEDERVKAVESVIPYIDQNVMSTSTEYRIVQMHNIIATLWDYIEEYILEHEKQGDSEQQMAQQLQQSQSEHNAQAPKGSGAAKCQPPKQQTPQTQQQTSQKATPQQPSSTTSNEEEEGQGQPAEQTAPKNQSEQTTTSSNQFSDGGEEQPSTQPASKDETAKTEQGQDGTTQDSNPKTSNEEGEQEQTSSSQQASGNTSEDQQGTNPNPTTEEGQEEPEPFGLAGEETDGESAGGQANAQNQSNEESLTDEQGTTIQNRELFRKLLEAKATKQEVGGEKADTTTATSSLQEQATAELNQMLEKVAADMVEQNYEEEALQEQCTFEASIPYQDIHLGVPMELNRYTDIPDWLISDYKKVEKDIVRTAKRMTESIREEVELKLEGDTSSGYINGTRIHSPSLYRQDKKMWTRKKDADDSLDLAVAILVDESGSMDSDNRIGYAKMMASICKEFCNQNNVPCAIYGHTTCYDRVILDIYATYDSIDGNDKYRIMGMHTQGCNRDGKALQYVCEDILRQDEARKLVILISDGSPNHKGYSGTVAYDDLRAIKARYRKKGVEIIAAAIGEDREVIKSIYGDGYLNMSDVKKMPRAMAKLIKNQLL